MKINAEKQKVIMFGRGPGCVTRRSLAGSSYPVKNELDGVDGRVTH